MALDWIKVSFSVRQGFWLRPKLILEGIDLSVPGGSITGLVGPNGAGKTTTIKLGAGLISPTSGQVLIQGRKASEAGAKEHLGLLTEIQYTYPHLRLREWLDMLAGLSGLKGSGRTHGVDHALDIVDLRGQADQMMGTLSKGQIQRAGLAQAFLHKPSILLLDEPMSGLDPYWRYCVQHILQGFKSGGGTILFSSHILSDVERLCDRVALIKKGCIQWTGRLADLPRETRGYEVICRVENPDLLKQIAPEGKAEALPTGEWHVSIPVDQKEEVLWLVSAGKITLESLLPIQDEIEDVIFGFSSDSNRAGQRCI